MKIGIIDVGGGMRGIYGAGVFDYLMDKKINIPYCIGVSAGSANIASYLSKQRGRNKIYYTEYSFEKDYISFSNLLKKGSILDLEYIYGTLSNENGKYPWDFEKAMENKSEMIVVATDAETGDTVYFDKKDFIKNDYGMFKASSCIPIVCKAYNWHGKYYYDGAISNPIPVEKAFSDGCDKVIIILTRPKDYRKKEKYKKMFSKIKKKYPNLYPKLENRCKLYNDTLDDIIQKYEENKKVLIVAPDNVCNVDTLKFKKENLEKLYEKGYKDAKKIEEFLSETHKVKVK